MGKRAPKEIGWSPDAGEMVCKTINTGYRVTITDRFDQERTGRAVMKGPAGWVLNMGGPHGTPAIATEDNIVAVVKGWPGKKLVGHPLSQKEREAKARNALRDKSHPGGTLPGGMPKFNRANADFVEKCNERGSG